VSSRPFRSTVTGGKRVTVCHARKLNQATFASAWTASPPLPCSWFAARVMPCDYVNRAVLWRATYL
jgi:hypothetical protein